MGAHHLETSSENQTSCVVVGALSSKVLRYTALQLLWGVVVDLIGEGLKTFLNER